MAKSSVVMRVPVELATRIAQYEKLLAQNGIRMGKTDVMRNFAENAITPRDSVSTFLGTLDRASKKRL